MNESLVWVGLPVHKSTKLYLTGMAKDGLVAMKPMQALSSDETRVRRRNKIIDCPLTAALAAFGGKWKMIIIYWLAESPKHFAAIQRAMPGISHKVLTQQLRQLMSDEIVQRQPNGATPAPVIYSLTDYGQLLVPLVENVRVWGSGHIQRFSD